MPNYWFVSIAIFVLCLFFPGYYAGPSGEPMPALQLLAVGWLGPADGHFSWYANLLFALSIIFYRKKSVSTALAFYALCFALSFLLYGRMGETTADRVIMSLGWGYILWVTAISILLVGHITSAQAVKRKTLFLYYFILLVVIFVPFIYHHYFK